MIKQPINWQTHTEKEWENYLIFGNFDGIKETSNEDNENKWDEHKERCAGCAACDPADEQIKDEEI